MFLGDNNDFICQTGIEDGMPCVCERFQGALELAYSGKSGSIYGLASAHFQSGQTTWSAEVVSDQPEKVLEEIGVEDALVYLRELEKEGKLRIYRFPLTPGGVPTKKSDLIVKSVRWTIDFGEQVLEDVKKYHPDILHEVLRQLS